MAERDNSKLKLIAARTRKQRARNLRLVRIFSVCICVFFAFCLGFGVRGNAQLLQSLGFPSSMTGLDDASADASKNKDVFVSFTARLGEVEDILTSDSLETYDLNTATSEMLGALANASDGSSLEYFDPVRYEQLISTNSGTYSGIGVMFSEYNGQAYVVDVFDGSAAQLAGVEEGDFVVAIDGDRSHKWSRSEVISRLGSSSDSSVVIAWRRPVSLQSEGGEEYAVSLVCDDYTEQNVTTDLNDSVGYIQLRQVTENSASLVRQAITELESRGAQSYVLDLRDNPGGYLNQAVSIASLFIPSGNVVQIQTIDNTTVKAVSGSIVTSKPLVVLVNGNTAASAEVLAAALKESQRATVVGVTTLGKGSVQVTRELSFGGALRYTAAYYTTAQGHNFNGSGVQPSIYLTNGDSGDAQLDYATEFASGLASSPE